jgi:hypothetical protein
MVTKEICIQDYKGKASCHIENQKYQFLALRVYQMIEVGDEGMMLGWEWYCVCVHVTVASGTHSSMNRVCGNRPSDLKGLSYEIDFENVDEN